MRFFKKPYPGQNVVLSNGQAVKFSGVDGSMGYFQTENQFLIDEFERKRIAQQDGITEITVEEYTQDYLDEKKNPTQARSGGPWREEVGSRGYKPSTIDRAGAAKVQDVVAANGSDIKRPEMPGSATSVEQAEPSKEKAKFTPNVGKKQPKR